ncbi:MAG: hypothetical protein JRF53_17740 [Deltaproteobacteria bacterium]|nr:hypothetical protein [Deltaproteobacteria bacterium]
MEKTEAIVKERMENVYPLRVPLKVHLGWGANWAETKFHDEVIQEIFTHEVFSLLQKILCWRYTGFNVHLRLIMSSTNSLWQPRIWRSH